MQLISSTKVVGADENNGFGGRVGGSFWGKGGVCTQTRQRFLEETTGGGLFGGCGLYQSSYVEEVLEDHHIRNMQFVWCTIFFKK